MANKKASGAIRSKYGAGGSRERKLNARSGRAPVAPRSPATTKSNWELADEIIFGRKKK